MTCLGVIAALPDEACCLTGRPIPTGDPAKLGGDVLVQVAGLGAERTRRGAERLLALGATALASWGSAGGLASDLSPGALVLPEMILAEDNKKYAVDADWHARLSKCLQDELCIQVGTLIESTKVLATPAEKSALFVRSSAVATDMESAAVAEAARSAGVPCIVIRAIVDTADITIPVCVTAAIDQEGQVQRLRLLAGLLRRPTDLLPVMRLGNCFRQAQMTLGKVARLAGPSLLNI